MGQVVLAGNPPIEIALRRSARSRRLSLRVSRLDGRVTLSLPQWTGTGEALEFAREKEDWIRSNLATRVTVMTPQIGGTILFQGQDVAIIGARVRAAGFKDGKIIVPADPDRAPVRLAAFFKLIARQRLSQASDHYAALLGKRYNQLTLRDTRSRWGSCTSDGKLMYSWRLIMAPPKVLDYVAAHEVSHLVEMNHSSAYWDVVHGIFPDYKRPRHWLRKHGQGLHAYRFGN